MSRFPGNFVGGQPLNYQSREQELSVGQFFNAVFAWMAAGLALTAVVAYAASNYWMNNPGAFSMGTFMVLFIVEIGLVMVIGNAINRISAGVATGLFLLYAALNGLSLSVLFLVYTHESLAGAFLTTAGAFGATSLYGYVTKRDLTRLGSLLFMALIGLIIASVVSFFWANSALYWIINYAGVLIFIGLTAYQTQQLKSVAIQTSSNPALAHRLAVVGSLQMYLNFVNLFLFMLRIMGNRRR